MTDDNDYANYKDRYDDAEADAKFKRQWKKADALLDKEKYDKALPILEELANQGYVPAQSWLGWCYFSGNAVSKDYAKAVEWFLKAAKQGYAQAQFCLGCCFEIGNGIQQNYSVAGIFFDKAANQNFVGARNKFNNLKLQGKI